MATSQNSKLLEITDPFDGKVLGEIPWAEDREIETALERAQAAFLVWKHSTAYDRSLLLKCMAEELNNNRLDTENGIIDLICREAGKPLTFATIETDRALGVLEWARAEALRFSGETLRLDTTKTGREGFGIVQRFPRGVILGITPFNFPLNLLIHKVAPALASGNCILVKPSPFTPLTAKKMEGFFLTALEKAEAQGFSDLLKSRLKNSTKSVELLKGLFQVVMASDEQTAKLTAHAKVAMVSFTGSAKVGWSIRSQAHQKPVTLELGGNAWVVLAQDIPSAQLEPICKRIATAAYGYAGQSCISVQNIAVAKAHWAKFIEIYTGLTQRFAYGDPRASGVSCGPVINASAHARLTKLRDEFNGKYFQSDSRVNGASPGHNLVAPTLFLEPGLDEKLTQQEVFGPFCNAIQYTDPAALPTLINRGPYGLQSGIFTNDLALAQDLYSNLDVGGVIVNDVPTTRYDHQPYGGVKDSGFGREGMKPAMEEMTEPRFLSLSAAKYLFASFLVCMQLVLSPLSLAEEAETPKPSTASLENRLKNHPNDITKITQELTALDESWEKVSEKEGVLTHRREVEDSPLVEFRGETVMDTSVAKILSILTDTPRKKEWVDRLEEAKDLRIESPFSRVEYNHTAAPWPAKDRDFIFSAKAFADPSEKAVLILLKSVEDSNTPEQDCCVRAQIVQGFYYLKSLSPQQTKVIVAVNADPKGSVPKWIVNMIQKSWPRKTLLSLQAQADKEDVVEKASYVTLFERAIAPQANAAGVTGTTVGSVSGSQAPTNQTQKVEPKTKL